MGVIGVRPRFIGNLTYPFCPYAESLDSLRSPFGPACGCYFASLRFGLLTGFGDRVVWTIYGRQSKGKSITAMGRSYECGGLKAGECPIVLKCLAVGPLSPTHKKPGSWREEPGLTLQGGYQALSTPFLIASLTSPLSCWALPFTC